MSSILPNSSFGMVQEHIQFRKSQQRKNCVKRETISDLMYCRDAAGPNSELSYAFATATDLFDLDETSGIITTTSRLKYYTASSSSLEAIGGATDNSYRMRVVATDAGSPPMSSECEVSITVVNGNNHPPSFKLGDNFQTRSGH